MFNLYSNLYYVAHSCKYCDNTFNLFNDYFVLTNNSDMYNQ